MSRGAVTRMSVSVALVMSACVALATPAAADPPSATTLAGALDAPAGVTAATSATGYNTASRTSATSRVAG